MLIYFGYKALKHYIMSPNKKSDKKIELSEEIKRKIQEGIDKEVTRINKATEDYQHQIDRIIEIIKNTEELRKQGLDISGKIKLDIFDIDISSKRDINNPTHE